MSAVKEIINALLAGGMDAIGAAALVARAAVEMTAAQPVMTKSVGAMRQQRFRDRHKSVTRDVTSVTEIERNEASPIVTKRNENVTPLRPDETAISYFPSKEKISVEKKESKKERATKKRNAPLREDWLPSMKAYQIAEDHGVNVQVVEQIFRDYLKSSGKLYADYDAAFYNFLRNQRRFNGTGQNAKTENPRSGSLIAAIDRELAKVEREENAAIAAPEDTVLRFPGRPIF